MKVRIACRGAETRDIDALVPFQGDLKVLQPANATKLQVEIEKLGFSEPIAVWEHDDVCYVLNGHQRLAVLLRMRADGWEVPPVPVSLVEAADEAEARYKVLSLVSQFGTITENGLKTFLDESGIDVKQALEDFSFPELDYLAFELESFGDLLSESTTLPPAEVHGEDKRAGRYILHFDSLEERTAWIECLGFDPGSKVILTTKDIP